MKTAALRDVKAQFSQYCQRAQHERVLVTKHGKPLALMIGVQGRELEELLTTGNPEFWQLVDQRRQQPQLTDRELRKRLGLKNPGPAGGKRPRSASKKKG